jgi:hypothetical protein
VVVFNEVEDALAAKKALHKQLAKGITIFPHLVEVTV